jgi:positive regulator of sigma E activity
MGLDVGAFELVPDRVEIAVPDDVLVKGALFVYIMPLVSMLLVAVVFESLFSVFEFCDYKAGWIR